MERHTSERSSSSREDVKDRLNLKLASFGRAALLGALVAVGTPSHGRTQEAIDLQETKQITERILGPDLVSKIEKMGLRAIVSLRAGPRGPYMIHVGQTHKYPRADFFEKLLVSPEKSAASQAEILTLLPEISRAVGHPYVFTEGLADAPDEIQKTTDILRGGITEINQFSDSGENATREKSERMARLLGFITENAQNRFMKNSITEQEFVRAQAKLTRHIQELEARGENMSRIRLSLSSLNFSASSLEFDSATLHLGVKGIVKLLPADDSALLAQAHDALNTLLNALKSDESALYAEQIRALEIKLRLVQEEIVRFEANGGIENARQKASDEKATSGERQKWKKHLHNLEGLALGQRSERDELIAAITQMKNSEPQNVSRARAEFTRIGYDLRERNVISNIASMRNYYGQSNVVVVFGELHRFAGQLVADNARRQDVQLNMGLIEVKRAPQ